MIRVSYIQYLWILQSTVIPGAAIRETLIQYNIISYYFSLQHMLRYTLVAILFMTVICSHQLRNELFKNTTPLWAGATYKILLRGWWRFLLEKPLSFHSSSLISLGTLTLTNRPYFSNPLSKIFTSFSQLPKQQCNQYWYPQAWVWSPLTIMKCFLFFFFLNIHIIRSPEKEGREQR